MNPSDWLESYFRGLFSTDVAEGLYPWDEDSGEDYPIYIDDKDGSVVMTLRDDDGCLYELRVRPL